MGSELNMAWDEEFNRWIKRMRSWWRVPLIGFRDFEDIDHLFDKMFEEMTQRLPKDLIKEKKLPGGGTIKKIGPFVYGYSMTIGPDGKPVVREFGNIKPSLSRTPSGSREPSLQYMKKREPLVDLIEDDSTIRVVVEVPGVEKEDIVLTCTEKTLIISVDTEKRKYFKKINLPVEVDPKVGKANCNNGVLEVTLSKVKRRTSVGERIRLD